MHVHVEGSTALTMRAGDEAARNVLTETKRIVRERVEAFGGREIDAVGSTPPREDRQGISTVPATTLGIVAE